MAFNPDEGEAVDTGFNPDLGEPVDTTFNPDAGTQVDSTYAYASNDEYEDLKRAVGDVGYSGLDKNQKKLFDAQLVNSKAASNLMKSLVFGASKDKSSKTVMLLSLIF